MRLDDFKRWLNKLEQASSKTSALSAREALAQAEHARWLDDELCRRIDTACERVGICPLRLAPTTLAIGESWLLLYDPASRSGRVGRLHAHQAARSLAAASVLEELEQARLGLGSALAGRRLMTPSCALPRAIEIELGDVRPEIEGGSLGVAACAAWMSRALGKTGRPDVAASAEVRRDGSLGPVAHLEPKLAALARARPEVAEVIVASTQECFGSPLHGITLVSCTHVLEALTVMGLSPNEIERPDAHAVERAIDELRYLEELALSSEGFYERAVETLTLYALATHVAPERAAECLRWGALFALHAGAPGMAEELLRTIPETQLAEDRELATWRHIIAASAMIDRDPLAAVQAAEVARTSCAEVESPKVRRALLARANGTLGRALMHAGRACDAQGPLEEAIAIHASCAPREVPRSQTYLTQCLRL
ncbi:MAG: hypothetical protein JWN48_256, partial [Myxococcaceae bacterium]|nr:hypothetical protein [Myxococcaceae bacterium]